MSNKTNITVLVAPLDWGLGHAARCIPLINHLLKRGCKIIIAAEGLQKKLLKSEFPNVIFVEIPGYNIKYTKDKRFFALKIILQIPKIVITISREKKWLSNFIKNNKVEAVISDNRFGLFHPRVTSVFITHQLLIKAPFLFIENVIRKINYSYIKKFSVCWVPDEKGSVNLAGALSHPDKLPAIPVNYIGGISRFERRPEIRKKYAVLIILSGAEPQRTLLEKKMLGEVKNFEGKALLVRGLPGNATLLPAQQNLEIKNYLPAKELEKAINESEFIISRSGYTTVMDICKLQKKSILIPTPGQTEQEYLAKHLQEQGWCLATSQEDFSLQKSLKQAQEFNYRLPDFKMEMYKEKLTDFVNSL